MTFLIFTCLLVAVVCKSVFFVGPGHWAFPYFFGKFGKVYEEGMHLKWPWHKTIELIKGQQTHLHLSLRNLLENPVAEPSVQVGQVISNVIFSYSYQIINPEKAVFLYALLPKGGFGDLMILKDFNHKVTTIVLTELAYFTVSDLNSVQKELEAKIQIELKNLLHGYGVELLSFDINEITT